MHKYHCSIFDVFEKKVKFPNGKKIKQSFIIHKTTVAIIPILNIKNGILLLLKQYRPILNDYIIEIPAGTLHDRENSQKGAVRELIEEIGYSTKKLYKIYEGYITPGYCNEYMHIYIALNLYKINFFKKKDKNEILDVFCITIDDAFIMLKKGIIKDFKSVIALFFLRDFLRNKKKGNY